VPSGVFVLLLLGSACLRAQLRAGPVHQLPLDNAAKADRLERRWPVGTKTSGPRLVVLLQQAFVSQDGWCAEGVNSADSIPAHSGIELTMLMAPRPPPLPVPRVPRLRARLRPPATHKHDKYAALNASNHAGEQQPWSSEWGKRSGLAPQTRCRLIISTMADLDEAVCEVCASHLGASLMMLCGK
jgi:hypothetical protein